MNTHVKCSYCFGKFSVTNVYRIKDYCPYILLCGHSICDACITTNLKIGDAITCKTCKKVSKLSNAVAKELRTSRKYKDVFPVNKSLLGSMLYEHIMASIELHKPATATMRVTYPAGLSQSSARGLVPRDINKDIEKLKKTLSICNRHPHKPLILFCTNCSKAICVNCVSICGTHKIIELKNKNSDCEADITRLKQTAKDIVNCIRKTTRDINNKLNRPRLPSPNEKHIGNPVAEHFDTVLAFLHITENRLVKEYDLGKQTYSKTLEDLKNLSEKLNILIDFSESTISLEEKEQIDYHSFVKLLEKTLDCPWYLSDDSIINNPDSSDIGVEINPEIFTAIEEHCKINVKNNNFELLPTSKLPPDVSISAIDESASIASGSDVSKTSDRSRRLFSRHPNDKVAKPLTTGSVERVVVTHINTPHEFFIQLNSIQPKLKELSQNFNKDAKQKNFVIPEVNLVEPGKLFLAYNEQDKQWDRVKIVAEEPPIDDSKTRYLVTFIDYGHTGNLAIKKLRILPPDDIPPMALKCRLVNCEPISKSWTIDDSLAMLRLVSSCKECLINIVKINEDCLDVILATCHNTPLEGCIYIADALIMLGKAVAGEPVYKNTKLSNILPIQQRGFNRQTIAKNDSVVICNAVSVSNFWVRKVQLCEFFTELSKELKEAYSIENPTGSLYSYEIGLSVAVHDIDHGWCRGQIEKLPVNNSNLTVILVDFGIIKIVHWTALRKLLPNFLKIDQLATHCQLAGWKQLGNEFIDKSKTVLTEYMTQSTPLKVETVKSVNAKKDKKIPQHKIEVRLNVVTDGEDERSINAEIFEKQLSSANIGDVLIPEYHIMKRPEDVKEDKETNLTSILKLEVNILSAASPSDIYITIKSQQMVLDNLSQNLQLSLKDSQPNVEVKWNVNDYCAVFSNQTKIWHRAIVKELLSDDKIIRVFTQDSAVIEDVALENLRVLEQKFVVIKDGAVKCHLSGIMPGAGTQWPNYTKEFCQDLLSQYDRFYITKSGPIVDKSIPVELWVYHVTPGDALTPTFKDWLCINTKILEQGLAIRNITEVKKISVEESRSHTISETLQTTKLSDTPIKAAESCEISILPVKEASGQELQPLIQKNDTPDIDLESVPPILDNWIPAEPLPSREFVGLPTFLTSEFVVLLHDVVHSTPTLQFLNSTLTHRFKDSALMPSDMFWYPGQLCIAKWEVDNQFYRGKINKILDNNLVEVAFVDYGNTEHCPISNLRKNIVMHHIPVQATMCRLTGLNPAEGVWSENVLDFIHQQIVEQQCLITVTGDPVDGIIPIKLKVNGIHDIGETLVSLGYATYEKIPVPKTGFKKKSDIFINDSVPSIIEDIQNAAALSTLVKIDWNEMNFKEEMGKQEDDSDTDGETLQQFASYPVLQFPSDCDFFECDVLNFTCDCEVTVRILLSENQLQSLKEKISKISNEMQNFGDIQPVEKCILEGKPCIAKFSLDNCWYRAKILQYDPVEMDIKVYYVDFGNSEIVKSDKVREIKQEWLAVPAQTISAKLNSVSTSDSADVDDLKRNFKKIFTESTFVRIIEFDENDDLFIVDFTKDISEPKLAYQNLIDAGLLINDQ